MNILLLSEFFPDSQNAEITGGVESRAYYIAKHLSKKHNIFVLTSKRKNQKKISSLDNISIIRLGPDFTYSNYSNLLQRVLFSINIFLNMNKLIKKYSIDLIDTMSYFTYPIIFIKMKAKKYLTYHEVWLGNWIKNTGSMFGVIGELAERIVLFGIKMSDTNVISVSNFTKKILNKRCIKNISVINNGVDLEKYKAIKVEKYNYPTVCAISRLIPQKRIDDLLYAFSIVKKKIPALKLKIIGQGEEKNALIKLASKLNISHDVEFVGHLKRHEEVIKILKRSHVFVNPSIREGFGITVIEAAVCSVPFVCSDIEPFIEVTKKKGGFIFRQKNYYDLADKLLILLKDKKIYNKKLKECSELAESYDWKNIVKKLYT